MACPRRALDFDTLAALQSKYGTVASIEGLPDPSQTNPSVVFKAYPTTQPQDVPYDTNAALRYLIREDRFQQHTPPLQMLRLFHQG